MVILMTDVELAKLGDLFPRAVFEIPRYQRGYSWTNKQITDLIEDLEYTLEQRQEEGRTDFTHYFGTVVLQDKGVYEGQTRNFDSYSIIDGQQRLTSIAIFISAINDELRSISLPDPEENSILPESIADDNRDDFISQHGVERIKLDSLNNDTYQELITEGKSPSSISEDNLSQRRLVESKKVIQNWLQDRRTENEREYYEFLRDLGKVVKNGLELTTYIIDDESEAGRLFEVVNDRGKDLTTLDKIKSYLVYCAAQQDDRGLAKQVYRKVGEVIRNITKHGGRDSDIEAFVHYHWALFTGELNRHRQSNTEYTDVHRRTKHLEKHASLEQETDSVTQWIESYLESLVECSEIFTSIDNPHLLRGENSDLVPEIINKLEGLHSLPVTSNFYPLLMAVYRRFGLSQEFYTVLDLCEKLSFRVYNVANRRTDAAKISLSRHAYWIEWAGRRSEAESVFSGRQNTLKFDSTEESLVETCQMIESEIGNHCPDTYFVKCLLRDDVLNGTDANDGWTGVRNDNSIQYLLYQYEKNLRNNGSKSNLSQIPPFSQWKSEGLTIEHIYPQNPEQPIEDLEEVKDSLGNLALLGPEDNTSAGNREFSWKQKNVYSNSVMQMFEELPSSEGEWDSEVVRGRARDIVEFALEEWGGLSKAHVHVNSSPSGVDETHLTQVAHDVRRDYSMRFGFDIPSVHIQSNHITKDEEWEIVNSCPKCDSTLIDLESVSGWEATCAGCGENLEEPVYKVNINRYQQQMVQTLLSN